MKFPEKRSGAFTLTELLVVIAIIGILAALLLPAVSRSEMRAKRIWCINDLQQLGIGFQMFAHDHDSKFPMEVPMADGGSREFVQNGYIAGAQFYFAYRHFQALSNEVSEPKILVCPTDLRQAAQNVSSLQNSNVSYFVGVNADYGKPMSILAGDRNITSIASGNSTIQRNENGNQLRWTGEMHQFKGNILFADAHVEQWNNVNFPTPADGRQLDFFLPTVPTQSGDGSGGNGGSWTPYSSPKPIAHPMPAPATTSASTDSPANSTKMRGDEQNSSFKFQPVPATPASFPSNDTVFTNLSLTNSSTAETNDEQNMSAFDKHVVKTMRSVFEWLYMLLLLLLLLWLLYWLLRRKIKRANEEKANRSRVDSR